MKSENKRIAKNTLLLYFRMLFLSGISVFTVRVILEALGVIDYGIMTVVSSLVASLSFLNGTLSSATQRYFSYFLGNKDLDGYKKVFSLFLICYIVICFVVIIVGELIGYFFLNEWLNIPQDRLYAAKWVYQTTLISFIFQLCIIPFSASLIAHERMNGFAYISIFDGIFKLFIAYFILYSSFNRLILYGILTATASVLTFICYVIYCRINIDGCKFIRVWENGLFKELLSYTGWNLFGSISGMLATQGQNILLNIYFGPIINTAKGISDRITNVVQSFSSNFYLAVTPQIIKSFATKDLERMYQLAIRSTKFSFFLLLILSYPISVCMHSILNLWLNPENVSEDMIIFCRLALIYCLIVSLEQPITQMIRATGQIKKYQIIVGMMTLCFIPLAAIFLKYGYPPQTTMYTLIILYICVQFIRIKIAHKQVHLPISIYFKEAIFPILTVCCILIFLSFLLSYSNTDKFSTLLLQLAGAFATTITIICIFGLNNNERRLLLAKLHIVSH